MLLTGAQITKKGGVVATIFDPGKVTHIVTETSRSNTLKALGLKSLKEIPDSIPTVMWSWVSSGNKGSFDSPFLHAAFASRIDAGLSELTSRAKDKGRQKAIPLISAADVDMSLIS